MSNTTRKDKEVENKSRIVALPKVGIPVSQGTLNQRKMLNDEQREKILEAMAGKYKGVGGDTFFTTIKNADKPLNDVVAKAFNDKLSDEYYSVLIQNWIVEPFRPRAYGIYQPDKNIKITVTYFTTTDEVDSNGVKIHVVKDYDSVDIIPRLRFGRDAKIPTDNVQSGMAKVLLPNYRIKKGRSPRYFYYSPLSNKFNERLIEFFAHIKNMTNGPHLLRSILRTLVYSGVTSMEALNKTITEFTSGLIIDDVVYFIDVVFPQKDKEDFSINYMQSIINDGTLLVNLYNTILAEITTYLDLTRTIEKDNSGYPVVAYGQAARLRKQLNNSMSVIYNGTLRELTRDMKEQIVRDFEGLDSVEKRSEFLRKLQFIEWPNLTPQQRETYTPYKIYKNNDGKEELVPDADGGCAIYYTGVGIDTDVSRTAVNPVLRLKKVVNKNGVASCRGKSVLRELEDQSLSKDARDLYLDALGGEAFVNAREALTKHYEGVGMGDGKVVLNQQQLRMAGIHPREIRNIIGGKSMILDNA